MRWLALLGLFEAEAQAPARLAVFDACDDAVNTEYDLQGTTGSGAPFYKAVESDLHIYFDPSCDGSIGDSRWIIDRLDGTPDRNATEDLDGNLLCSHIAYLSSSDVALPVGSTSWIMECSGSTQTLDLTLEEVNRVGYQTAPAFFCSYNCGTTRGQVTRPGKCYGTSEVFATRGVSWMLLVTRAAEAGAGQNIPPLTDEWATYSAQDMTWEGWFHVNEAPADRSMLMGTFGTNDAETLYSGLHRRRHGAVWIDPDGRVGLSSNTGTTSGFIQGPQLVDGKWHHVAAVWNQTAGGGAQIAKSFKLMHVRYSTIIGNQDMREELTARMEEAMALEANASATDVWFYYADEQIIGGEGRLLVSFVVNCPIETVDMMLARLVSSHTFENRMLWALFNVTLITNAFTGLAPVQDNVYIYDDVFPTITYVGIAHLYVDGVAFPGLVIYSPNEENIADNGQFLVGGGHQARPVDLEVANLRLWSVALTQEQLAQQAQVCQVPDSESFIGGAWPFSLHGAWPLNGNFTNAFGPFANFSEQSVWEEQLGSGYNSVDAMNYPYWKNLLTAEVVQTYTQSMYHHMSRKLGGGFVRGGVCNFNACPAISPVNACPLQRSVGFASSAECEEFAGFNFCRLAGSTRNRPSMPHLQGCHL